MKEIYAILESILQLVIIIGLPIIGIVLFLIVNGKMYNELKEYAPTTGLALMFIAYGGLLILVLNELLFKNSQFPGIGIVVPAIIVPLFCVFYYIKFKHTFSLSNYHNWILKGCMAYPVLLFVLAILQS